VDAAEERAVCSPVHKVKFGAARSAHGRTSFIIATGIVRWRLLLSPPLGGPDNMALDEALMARARRSGESVLRVYGWARPTLSLGRNQRAAGQYDAGALTAQGIGVVRRPTGGRAILHQREITYSVTAPILADEGLGAAYGRINALLMNALDALGVPAAPAASRGRALAPSATPCFSEPAAGELVTAGGDGGRKLVGSAQWREDGALLQHGSILVHDDQERLPALMLEPTAAVPAPATLAESLGRSPTTREVAEALFDAVRQLADERAEALPSDAQLDRDAARLAVRYRDPAWTWRR
jgi:lipoate-protein ligase A